MRQAIRLALLILFFCTMLALPVYAETAEVIIAPDIDPSLSQFDLIDLYSDRNRWKNGSGTTLQRTAAVFQGRTLFGVPVHTLDSDMAYADFSVPCNLNNYHTLGLVCYIEDAENILSSTTDVTLTLIAGAQKHEVAVSLPANLWCEISFDIGSWAPRAAIDRIELHFPASKDSGAVLRFSYMRANAEMDDQLRQRFMTDHFSVRGGEIAFSTDKDSAVLIPNENSPIIEATLLPPTLSAATNAIRIIFNNASFCERLTLQYAYEPDGANARSITTTVGSGHQNCLFEVPNASQIRYIRLHFVGANAGTITLHAINVVSVYDSGIPELGALTECLFDASSRQITVRGTLDHDVMIANRENRLVLFPVYPWESVETALTDGRKPIATANISIRFEFRIAFDQEDIGALGAAYLVALESNDPNTPYTPIASPISLNLTAGQKNAEVPHFKGVQTEQIASAVQSGASLYLLDVYLDRLCPGSFGGYLFAHNGSCYYFDRTELEALDRAISLRSAAGADVYLRFLISSDQNAPAFALPFGNKTSNITRGILLTDGTAGEQITAVVEFLCTRYNGSNNTHGRIAGFVIGTQVNNASIYNEIGSQSLTEYVDRYAALLTLVTNVGRYYIPDLKVIVPISDRRAADCITPDMLDGSYDTELFLRSLFGRLDDRGGLSVSLMMESEHNPFAITEESLPDEFNTVPSPEDSSDPARTVAAGNGRKLSSLSVSANDYYTVDHLEIFTALIDTLAHDYRSMSLSFIFCWTPEYNTGDLLSSVYSYLYYRLRFSEHAESFIVSFKLAETAGETGGMPALRHLIKYIDTPRSVAVTEHALDLFSISDWREIIPGFSADQTADRMQTERELAASAPEPLGQYDYFRFATSHSIRGWFTGTHVSDLSVKGSGNERALTAEIDLTTAETGAYAEIIYRFSPAEPIQTLDRIAFDLVIEGEGVWEICIIGGNDHACAEQKKIVEAGKRSVLFFTVADEDMLEEAEYLRIGVKPVSGNDSGKLCLFSVVGEHDQLSSHALANALEDGRGNVRSFDTKEGQPLSLAWVFSICALVIFSITVAVLLGRHQTAEPTKKA
ncbi:MAG: hypothetical protein IKL84_06950 [Clostridia bacterium]|nr:hypothetical protein [Clostridia bacterium]